MIEVVLTKRGEDEAEQLIIPSGRTIERGGDLLYVRDVNGAIVFTCGARFVFRVRHPRPQDLPEEYRTVGDPFFEGGRRAAEEDTEE